MPRSVAARRILEITGKQVPPELEGQSEDVFTLEEEGGALYIRARVNGVDGRFLLDTGASALSLYRSATRRFNVGPSARTAEIQTANGDIQVPVAHGELELGKHKVANVTIMLIPDGSDHGIDGLFGLEALHVLNAEIERGNRRLVVRGKGAL